MSAWPATRMTLLDRLHDPQDQQAWAEFVGLYGPLVFHFARRRLPQDCRSLRRKFDIAGHEGYIHVGLYEDGVPGELFIKIAKEGSTIAGLMDTIGDCTEDTLRAGVATGFKFGPYTGNALLGAVERALHCYRHRPDVWQRLQKQTRWWPKDPEPAPSSSGTPSLER